MSRVGVDHAVRDQEFIPRELLLHEAVYLACFWGNGKLNTGKLLWFETVDFVIAVLPAFFLFLLAPRLPESFLLKQIGVQVFPSLPIKRLSGLL